MNLLGTLARVAVGTMVARGVGKMISGKGASGSTGSGGGLGGLLGGLSQQQGQSGAGGLGGLGGLLGSLSGGGAQQGGSAGGLGGLLGSLASGGQQGGSAGGLGGLLGSLAGGGQQGATATAGGLGGLLGGALAGAGSQSGGLGGLLSSLGGMGGAQQQQGGGFGDLLNQALSGKTTPEPTPEQNSQAEIMLRAMINAAKSDGQIDADEKQKILGQLADAGEEERAFVRNEIDRPLDVDAFIASVPNGLQQQVYLMSLLAIELDSDAEAAYLDRLGQGLGISKEVVNQIHAKVGFPPLYS